MGYWLGIVFSCLDVLCVAVFCDAFLERKTRGLRFVVGALLCGVLSYIATIFVSHISEESPITLLKFAALITVYFVFASLFYLGKFWMRLLVVLLAYAIFTLLEFCVLYSLLALLHIRYDEYVANMKLYLASAAITYSLKFFWNQKYSQADGGKFRQHQMGTPDNWISTYFSGWYINLLLLIHERQNSSRICTFFKWNSAGNQCRDSDFDRFDRKKQPRAGTAKNA